MRFIRYKLNDNIYFGIEKENMVISFEDLAFSYGNLYDFIENHKEEDLIKIENLDFSSPIKIDQVELLSPFERTNHDIMCVGVNYQDHKDESKDLLSEDEIKAELPIYFPKRASKIYGPFEDLDLQFNIDQSMDYECELAVIIGKEGKDIGEDEALEYVFGYSIINDISARYTQKAYGQWYKGKSLDGNTVLGPAIVHKSQIEDPHNLNIKTCINGELRQDSNTKYMLRKIPLLISELSKGMTLVPGDIIATGTPEGVGQGFNPKKWLKSGDIIQMEIEKIGRLENRII